MPDRSISWNEMPRGIKIILVLVGIGLLSELFGVFRNFGESTFFFWIPVQFPFSLFVQTLTLVTTTILFIGIYKQKWWKLILVLAGSSLLGFLANSIWMLITPLTEIYTLMGEEIPSSLTPEVGSLAKLFLLVPILIGLAIRTWVWVYIFKKKDYFQNQSNINQELIKYIKTEEAQGYTPKQLREYLIKQGYDSPEVDKAIEYANQKDIYPK